MRHAGLIGLLLTFSFSATLQAQEPATPAEPAHQTPAKQDGPRVVLIVNRDTEIRGYLATEDENIIAIRNLKGQVESFAKSRVSQIVRLVDPAPGQTGIVVLRDGQMREGVLIEDNFDYVLVEIQGIRAKLKRESVSHVLLQPTFEQRYAQYKASLQPGMYDAHFTLCKWLFERRRYDLAKKELDDLLDKAEMAEARKLLNVVEAQLALLQKPESAEKPTESENSPAATPTSDSSSSETGESSYGHIISKADVNLIRVFEIDFENPPKITITPETVRAIIDKYGASKEVPASQTGRNAMFRAASDQPLQIVRLMFDLRARDLYSQIQVNSEPHSLNLFRQRIHDTWLMNNCATSRCHGGPEAPATGFYLNRKNYKDERVRYTNLLILERLKRDPQWPLINYDRPEDSLIIQYGLSREDATCRKPHPATPGWKAAFSPISPRMKQDAIEWIKSMMQPRPEYPVDFVPTVTAPPPPIAPIVDPNRPLR